MGGKILGEVREGEEGLSKYEGVVVREGSVSFQGLCRRAVLSNDKDQDGSQA